MQMMHASYAIRLSVPFCHNIREGGMLECMEISCLSTFHKDAANNNRLTRSRSSEVCVCSIIIIITDTISIILLTIF